MAQKFAFVNTSANAEESYWSFPSSQWTGDGSEERIDGTDPICRYLP